MDIFFKSMVLLVRLNETQHHSNDCHGWPYSTPLDQTNFSVHFRLFPISKFGHHIYETLNFSKILTYSKN